MRHGSAAPTVVAIPARDEEDCIVGCLEALAGQVGATPDHIVLLANNCTDATAALARAVRLNPGTRLHVLERDFPPVDANAGMARRLALAEAARLAGPDGILLTTDADGLVDETWLAANLAALAQGVEVVAGWVELHPIDWGRIPAKLHEDDAQECAYDALCDEIHARLDPDPHDPMPRHTQHSGASIAVTAAAYGRCGGIPAVPTGEDRALIAALRRVDAPIRHAPSVRVVVSGRIAGRAAGGMADTIRRRMIESDSFLDGRLEAAATCALRATCRATLRQAYFLPGTDLAGLAARMGLAEGWLASALQAAYFGQAWAAAEAAAPALRSRPVPVAELPQQMQAAQSLLEQIRAGQADQARDCLQPLA